MVSPETELSIRAHSDELWNLTWAGTEIEPKKAFTEGHYLATAFSIAAINALKSVYERKLERQRTNYLILGLCACLVTAFFVMRFCI